MRETKQKKSGRFEMGELVDEKFPAGQRRYVRFRFEFHTGHALHATSVAQSSSEATEAGAALNCKLISAERGGTMSRPKVALLQLTHTTAYRPTLILVLQTRLFWVSPNPTCITCHQGAPLP